MQDGNWTTTASNVMMIYEIKVINIMHELLRGHKFALFMQLLNYVVR